MPPSSISRPPKKIDGQQAEAALPSIVGSMNESLAKTGRFFPQFWFSLWGETRFSGNFDFPSGGKRSFRVILIFPLGGNAVFG